MDLKKLYCAVALLLCLFSGAQNDTIIHLDKIVLTDTQLQNFSASQSVLQLNDSVIVRSPASLGALLTYNSIIYFKENGLGMVSSPSFRGTTAQQTAVLWNGININSQLNGQTDFNTINTTDFNRVEVRAGGGSVIYGSSAIGGTIHLTTALPFRRKTTNTLLLNYGSYNTLNANYTLKAATDKVSTDISISRNSSDNDYTYPDTDIINENGQFYNTSYNASLAYKINSNNILRLYSYAYDGERHFSGTLSAPSQSKYQDVNSRNMIEWLGIYGGFTSKLKMVLLTEQYKYYARHTNNNYTFGKVNTWIGRYDIAYDLANDLKLNTIIDYTNNRGSGTDITTAERNIGSASLLMKHQISDKVNYELGIRKEITDIYPSPLLFSAGARYQVSEIYALKINTSRNFRIPTFNDLYWQSGGNPDLKPESSYQAEIGNEFYTKNIKFTVTGYYIKLQDMLRWVPTGTLWQPENVGKVNSYGFESVLNWKKKKGNSHYNFNSTYAYTVSKEAGKSKQLIYVPYHKATASIAYAYKKITAYYRHLFTGSVFTTSDNSSDIDPYTVATLGAEYHFAFLQGLDIGIQSHNLWDAAYQNVSMRPMPGRNYTMYLNFKF